MPHTQQRSLAERTAVSHRQIQLHLINIWKEFYLRSESLNNHSTNKKFILCTGAAFICKRSVYCKSSHWNKRTFTQQVSFCKLFASIANPALKCLGSFCTHESRDTGAQKQVGFSQVYLSWVCANQQAMGYSETEGSSFFPEAVCFLILKTLILNHTEKWLSSLLARTATWEVWHRGMNSKKYLSISL